MTTPVRRHVIALVAGLALMSTRNGVGQSTLLLPASNTRLTLGVSGLMNATPSLAALGRTVVAVWTAGQSGTANVFAAVSNDGGYTFAEPRRVNNQEGDVSVNNEQPPRVTIAAAGAARVITVIWSKRSDLAQKARQDVIHVSRSTDEGRTFSTSQTIHNPRFSGARGWQSLTTAPDGTVHVVWLDGRNADKKAADSAAPKGQPWQDIFHGTVAADGHIVVSQITGGVCFCCKTAVAVDSRGVVYAAWRHIFPTNIRDIAFSVSTDRGLHFGPLIRVSEDKWELNGCPEDGPAMAVEPSGIVHIVWPTVVTDGEPRKALFYATSRDGKTFSARARVPGSPTGTPSHPQLTLTPDGGAVVAWDELADGVRRVSIGAVSARGEFRSPQVLSSNEAAFYPVAVRTASDNVVVAWTSRPPAAPDRSMIALKHVRLTK